MTELPPGPEYFTTGELTAADIRHHAIRRLLTTGRLHRVTHGLYTTRRPAGRLLLRALQHQSPGLVFTGVTAVQIRRNQAITTPAHVLLPRNQRLRSDHLVTALRAAHRPYELIDDLRTATPLRLLQDLPEGSARDGVRLLEKTYRGRDGRLLLERDLAGWTRVPGTLRGRINAASIGADSETERHLFRALRRRGYVFEQNKLLGHHFRDGVYEPRKVVVEVNGYDHHRDRATMVKDYWKATDVTSRGYRHLTFSETCIDLHLPQVVDAVVAVIEGRAVEVRPLDRWHSVWTQPHAVGLY